MSDRLRIAAAQLTSTPDLDHNLALVEQASADAAAQGARIVACPEGTMAPFTERLDTLAEPLDGPFADGVRAIAERHDITVVVGMFTPGDEVDGRRRVRNTLLLTGPGAEAHYDKIHLYDAFGTLESETVQPGEKHVIVEVEGWQVGLATCYDVRFADQFTALGRLGAELIVLPTSWGDGPGKAEQWDLLTRARAADAQAWLLGAAQAWQEKSIKGPYGIGRSCVTGPMGQVRARIDGAPALLVTDIDRDAVRQARERVPILATTLTR